jgi:hypothetical protein
MISHGFISRIRGQFFPNNITGIKASSKKSKTICYLIKIDNFYELFVTRLGSSLLWSRRMVTIYFQLDCG